jgi:hypothetical protein
MSIEKLTDEQIKDICKKVVEEDLPKFVELTKQQLGIDLTKLNNPN